MKNLSLFPFERNRYFYGKLLTTRDFEVEQQYFNNKRRLLNLTLNGSGVVCGLDVHKSDDSTLMIESGMALDYLGREIVLPSPVVKKLPMLQGFSSTAGRGEAFLCLRYAEEPVEKVNAVGVGARENEQYNKLAEGYSLTLDCDEPNVAAILDADGHTHTTMFYSAHGIRLGLRFPVCVVAGAEFYVECIVLKQTGLPPLTFTLEFSSELSAEDAGRVKLQFSQEPDDTSTLLRRRYRLRACGMAGLSVNVARETPAQLQLRMDNFADSTQVFFEGQTQILKNREDQIAYLAQMDTLARKLAQSDLPIYLARLDLVPVGGSSIIDHVTGLPFAQRLTGGRETASSEGNAAFTVSTDVKTLKYWQKPEAQVEYNRGLNNINFTFGIPSGETHDYQTSSGVVEIPLSSGLRVNGRYFSAETPHNLGPGNVEMRVALEFPDNEASCLCFGNPEVFFAKNGNKQVPQVRVGTLLYPERGTFIVGVWLLDNVPGSSVRVRYFATKPSRDVDALRVLEKPTIQVLPEVQRLRPLARSRLKAVVMGVHDKRVLWSTVDENGGSVDENGLYQAPDVSGTYEVIARSVADPTCQTSAFFLVEE